MSTTKSIASEEDASSRASSTISEFVQRITHEFSAMFPAPSALGRRDSSTDESSLEDDYELSRMFDPIEFNNPNNHVVRKNSSQTVLTEEDSAWFFTGNEGAAMDDYAETDERPARIINFYNEKDMIPVPTFSQKTKESNHRWGKGKQPTRKNIPSKNRNRRRKQPTYDKTTICLAIMCIILTIIFGIMLAVVRPFRKNNSNNNNIGDVDTPDVTIGMPIPTLAPADLLISNTGKLTSSAPTRMPQIPGAVATTENPTENPSSRPTPSPPTRDPTFRPTFAPPTMNPTVQPTVRPTVRPTVQSTTANLTTTILPTAPPQANAVSPREQEVVAPLSIGPMVGHTTHDSVTLWAYHDLEDYTLEILLYDFETDGLLRQIDLVVPRKDRNNAIIETLTGLEPSTAYKFGMHIRGQRVGRGSFRTAPLPEQGTQFDYVLASCMNYRQNKNQLVWEEITKNNGGKYPDFSILAGDTVYLQEGVDVTAEEGVKFDRLWFRNQEQRQEVHFSDFIRNTPTYSTWNDHEYGDNNANKDQKGKVNSLRGWESLWANPGYGDATTDDGVYYSYYWGDVHYIVTDDHWYRDPSIGNRLGVKQTEWIRSELLNSRGTFKVIVIGSDIMERNWSSDLNNIGDIVRENSINGVLFHAGDIHRNEYKRMEAGGFPYPVTQITSSGIAKIWRRPYVHIKVNTMESDPSIAAHFYGASSMSDVTSWTNDPNLRCSSIVGVDRDKERSCTEVIRLSDLSVV